MRSTTLNSILKAGILVVAGLLLTAGASFAQSVSLTAAPATATLPDGTAVPMWGYSCSAVVAPVTATCANLNPAAAAVPGTWSPIVITVPPGPLTITLTNSLPVPTSLTIVGQLGGGLGDVTQRTTSDPPDHTNAQPLTWPIAGDAPGSPMTGVGVAPAQSRRVQSFSTEVAAGATLALPGWLTLRPGTYLIESGSHPSIQGPMGLYGILVVTTVPAGGLSGWRHNSSCDVQCRNPTASQ
jgi:FtsP/CotA-like multicopper oxidase with cupredoxin domain